MADIKYINIELKPAYWGKDATEMELSMEYEDGTGFQKVQTTKVFDNATFESLFDQYIKVMTAEVKDIVLHKQAR